MADTAPQRPTFVDPGTGAVYEFDEADATGAIDAGFVPETTEQRRVRVGEDKYGGIGGAAAAGALGTARGLTLGIGVDPLLTATGLVDKQTIKDLKEFQPGISVGTEIAGSILPVLASGGAGALAKGAATAGKLAVTSANIGARAGAAIAKPLAGLVSKGLAGKVLARAAEGAVAGTVESALYGVGSSLNELALGDGPLTAERFYSTVAPATMFAGAAGGVLGGALGAAGPLAGASLRKLAGVVRSADNVADDALRAAKDSGFKERIATLGSDEAAEARKAVMDHGDMASAEAALSDLSATKIADDIAGRVGGGESVKDALVNSARGWIAGMGEEINKLIDPDLLTVRALGGNQRTQRLAAAGARPGEITDATKQFGRSVYDLGIMRSDMGLDEMAKAARNVATENGARIGETRKVVSEILEANGKGVTLIDVLDDVRTNVLDPLADNASVDATKAHRTMIKELDSMFSRRVGALDDTIRPTTLDELSAKYGDNLDHVVTIEDIAKIKDDFKTQAAWEKTANTLGNPSPTLTNKAYRGLQGALEGRIKSAVRVLDDIDPSVSAAYREAKYNYGVARTVESILGRAIPADNAKVINGLVSTLFAGAAVGGATYEDMPAPLKILAMAAGTVGFTALRSRAPQVMAGLVRSVGKAKAAEIIKALDPIGVMTEAVTTAPTPSAPGAAAAAMSHADMMAAGATKAAAEAGGIKPLAKGLSAIDEQTTKVADRMMSALDKLSAGKRLELMAGPIAVMSADEIRHMRETAENPEAVAKMTELATADLAKVAPNAAAHMAGKFVATSEFLKAELPAPREVVGTMSAGRSKKWQPTQADKIKATHIKNAINDPVGVIEGLPSGKISPHAVKAIKAIYPEIYNEAVFTIANNFDKINEAADYKSKVAISILTGIPFDETMRPQYVAAMQATYSPQETQDQGGGSAAVGTRASGVAKISVGKKSQTMSERLAGR